MIASSLLVLYMIFVFFLASAFTWRVSHMINLEDGPMDIFEKFRSKLGIREFRLLSDEEQLKALTEMNLPAFEAPPIYVHNGSSLSKWFTCHGCISVLIGIITAIYLALFGYLAWALVPLYALALSFVSIKLEINL